MFMSLNQADFDHFLCHDELLVKVRPLAGLLRERTPDVKTGTVGKEIRKMVRSTRYNKDKAQLCSFKYICLQGENLQDWDNRRR